MTVPGPAGFVFLLVFLVLVPWGAYRSRARLQAITELPRLTYLRNVVWQQVAFLALALLTAWQEKLPIRIGRLDPFAVAVAVALTAAVTFALRPVWERKVRENDPRLALFAPGSELERRWWIGVSIAAGISEEVVWRGVVLGLLWWLTGSWVAAAVVSSVVFGVAHSLQGWESAAAIGAIAMGMALFVRWADGLALAMAMHAAYDIVAGLTYGKLLEDGVRNDGTTKGERLSP